MDARAPIDHIEIVTKEEMTMTITELKVGQRVQLHPASDAWMAGDRYGEVIKVGRSIVHVKMDRSGRVRWFHPETILETV